MYSYIHRYIHTYIHTYRQTDRQTDKQTDRHIEVPKDWDYFFDHTRLVLVFWHNSRHPFLVGLFEEVYERVLELYTDNFSILSCLYTTEPALRSFCTPFKLKNLIKESKCYKNSENSNIIYLFLANCDRSFHIRMWKWLFRFSQIRFGHSAIKIWIIAS